MASSVLPERVKRALDARVDLLFGRVIAAMPCPLTYNDRHVLGRCNVSQQEAQMIEAAAHLGVLNEVEYMNVHVEKTAGGSPYWIRLYGADAPDYGVCGNFNPRMVGMAHRESNPDRGNIVSRLGLMKATQYFKWVEDTVAQSEDIAIALETIRDIMKMARTAGHLHRMVPELYRLCPGLAPNPRASAVPYEWSKYPRQPVEWLTSTIARCSLLPETDTKWSERSKHTWPVVRED